MPTTVPTATARLPIRVKENPSLSGDGGVPVTAGELHIPEKKQTRHKHLTTAWRRRISTVQWSHTICGIPHTWLHDAGKYKSHIIIVNQLQITLMQSFHTHGWFYNYSAWVWCSNQTACTWSWCLWSLLSLGSHSSENGAKLEDWASLRILWMLPWQLWLLPREDGHAWMVT